MSSTLPKYVQAGQNSNSSVEESARTSQQATTQQKCQRFIETFKNLPEDFLRIPASYYPAHQQDLSLIPQTNPAPDVGVHPHADMIDISVVEAQLVKNYGLLRMDLYCKVRVGHYVAETSTCQNGARNPRWDNSGVYQFALKPGIDSFHLEIYDEKQFSHDEKIAWLHEPIPTEVFQGVTVERWFPLSGRLGPQKEGSILLVLSHKRVPPRASNFTRMLLQHNPDSVPMFMPSHCGVAGTGHPMVIGGGSSVLPINPNRPIYIQPQQPLNVTGGPVAQPALESRVATEEDVDQLSEMFPSIDKSIIKSVLENHQLDKEGAISALLAMG